MRIRSQRARPPSENGFQTIGFLSQISFLFRRLITRETTHHELKLIGMDASSVLEAEAEAVGKVSRFQIGGWDSY